MISATPGRFTLGSDLVATVQEVGWTPEPVLTGTENLTPTGIRSPNRPAHSESLYRLRAYTSHMHTHATVDSTFKYVCFFALKLVL